jgi:ketosteroid isomerase-like protein
MNNTSDFFETLYKDFNDRKIESVVANMTEDVKWANGMEGGFVFGRDGVRNYWTKQFEQIKSRVKPLKIEMDNEVIKVKVHQVVYDLNGNLLSDNIVDHIFHMHGEQVAAFDIADK